MSLLKTSLAGGALCVLALSSLRAQHSADVYVTAQATDQRLSKTDTLAFAADSTRSEKNQTVFVYPDKTFQTLTGIGGALTDASAETFAKLPEAKRTELLRAYYDTTAGIGYTLARTNIHSCDFSSDMYTYVADGDKELKTFSIAHDEKYRLPLIKAAIAAAGGKLTLFASPWSPPAWMKDNHDMLHGGKLLPEYRDTWAKYIAAFVKAYEKAGVPVWGLTVQNEPMAVQKWESCVFSAEDERDFVRDHLGPTLEKSGLGAKKLMFWDHNRTWMYQRAQVMLDDPQAAKYIWGMAFHWYVEDGFDNERAVKASYPAVHLFFTEGCNYPFSREKLGEWHWGENYGHAMIADFNAGAEGWTDWNILLDEHGGPNHVANYCYAPIHADTTTGELMYMNSYYYIGHFSKFIRPGAKRIAASATTDVLATTAFKNPDGSIALVVMNATEKAQPYKVAVGQTSVTTNSPAHSIMTVVIR